MQSSHEHSYCSNQSASFLNYSEKPPGVRLGLVLDPDTRQTLSSLCVTRTSTSTSTLCVNPLEHRQHQTSLQKTYNVNRQGKGCFFSHFYFMYRGVQWEMNENASLNSLQLIFLAFEPYVELKMNMNFRIFSCMI